MWSWYYVAGIRTAAIRHRHRDLSAVTIARQGDCGERRHLLGPGRPKPGEA